MAKAKLLRKKKAVEHRGKVRGWRKKFQNVGLVYRKIAGHYYWIPKKR